MTELTSIWLIQNLTDIQSKKIEYENLIMKLEIELEESDLVRRIMKGKEMLKELKLEEIDLKNKWINLLQKSNIKEFTSWSTKVRIKESPWKLIIDDESLIPEQYKEEVTKTTIKIDKKELKEDMKQGEIIEWVHLDQDVTLEIKYL